MLNHQCALCGGGERRLGLGLFSPAMRSLLVLFCTISVMCQDKISHGKVFKDTFEKHSTENSTVLRKCCDAGFLMGVEFISNISQIYFCIPESNFTSKSVFSLLSFDAVDYGFPESCPSEELVRVDLPDISEEACVDKVVVDGGQKAMVVGVQCDFNTSDPVPPPTILPVRKCCPVGLKYDLKLHACAYSNTSNSDPDQLMTYFGRKNSGFVDVTSDFPKCVQPSVLIDFQGPVKSDWQIGTFCVDELVNPEGGLGGRRCSSDRSFCDKNVCVPKCCPPGRSTVGSKCNPSEVGFNPTFYDTSTKKPTQVPGPSHYGIVHGLKCKHGKYCLDPYKDKNQIFHLEMNGNLFIPHQRQRLKIGQFCLEHVYHVGKNMDGVYSFVCFPEQPALDDNDFRFLLIPLGLVMSCVFLVATLLVYACLPSLNGNLHGKTLMFLMVSYLGAYICLATLHIGSNLINRTLCKIVGFCMFFSWLSNFAWLNVMCFDIWWTFGVTRSLQHGTRKQRDRRRLCLYALYAWGVPTIIVGFSLIMEYAVDISPEILKMDMGYKFCWFRRDTYAHLVFFVLPSILLIVCNVVLFTLTVRYCSRVKAEINRMQSAVGDRCKKRFQADKNKLIMNGKLFTIMGITWIFEHVSSFLPNIPELWYVSDAINVIQGVLIFAIFIPKRKVLRELGGRFGVSCCEAKTRTSTTAANRLTCQDTYSSNPKISGTSTMFTNTTTAKN